MNHVHSWVRLAGCVLAVIGTEVAAQDITRYPATATSGVARAVRVADSPLAHTTMLFGEGRDGRFREDVTAQARQALNNVERALGLAGASLATAVKLHVYLRQAEDFEAVNDAISERFAQQPVAVVWVTSALPMPGAAVGLDVVAVATERGESNGGVRTASADLTGATALGSHLAVMPPGRRVFFSGQAEPDPDLRIATRKTMESLGRGLAWMKLAKADVVQVKAFLRPFAEFRSAAEEIGAFFAGGSIPPLVLVEWANPSSPIEIEIVVAGRTSGEPTADGVAFLTPPGLAASPRFARIAVVDAGHPLIFISGLYGENAGAGREEWLEIFGQLGDILWQTGSSMRHQVKGTYYSATSVSRRLHGEIRDVFLDPARPPASSGMLTKGVGRPGKDSTIDMIAIPIPRPPAGAARK